MQDVEGWQKFYDDTAEFEPQSYIYDARRFSHKVYAMLDAFESRHRYVVWVDADIVFKKKFTDRFFKKLLDGRMVAFLGRNQCYTETGCLIFDTHHEDFKEFKERFRSFYDDKHIFKLNLWIDCLAFDASIYGLDALNLTPDAFGMCDVFPTSPLAEIMEHNKGQGHEQYLERRAG